MATGLPSSGYDPEADTSADQSSPAEPESQPRRREQVWIASPRTWRNPFRYVEALPTKIETLGRDNSDLFAILRRISGKETPDLVAHRTELGAFAILRRISGKETRH